MDRQLAKLLKLHTATKKEEKEVRHFKRKKGKKRKNVKKKTRRRFRQTTPFVVSVVESLLFGEEITRVIVCVVRLETTTRK